MFDDRVRCGFLFNAFLAGAVQNAGLRRDRQDEHHKPDEVLIGSRVGCNRYRDS